MWICIIEIVNLMGKNSVQTWFVLVQITNPNFVLMWSTYLQPSAYFNYVVGLMYFCFKFFLFFFWNPIECLLESRTDREYMAQRHHLFIAVLIWLIYNIIDTTKYIIISQPYFTWVTYIPGEITFWHIIWCMRWCVRVCVCSAQLSISFWRRYFCWPTSSRLPWHIIGIFDIRIKATLMK